jgi:hypothetical protein
VNRKRLCTWSLLGATLYAAVVFQVGSSFASRYAQPEVFSVDAAEKISAQNGDAEQWVISGSGFDESTRVILSADVGNLHALVGSVPLEGNTFDLNIVDEFIYVANKQLGLQVLDLENPLRPKIRTTYQIEQAPVDIFQDGERLFVSCARETVRVYDVSQPAVRKPPAIIKVDGRPSSSRVGGTALYVATGMNGVHIFDVTQLVPGKIIDRAIARIDVPGKALSLFLEGDTLFVATDEAGLLVYHVADPAHPQLLATVSLRGSVLAVAVLDGTLYLGDNAGYVSWYDIRDRSAPVLVGDLYTGGQALDFALDGQRLYIADSLYGLLALDIAERGKPEIVGCVDVPGQARSVSLRNGLAYVASNSMGVQVVDLSAIEKQHVLASVETPGSAKKLLLDGEWLYVADFYGLQIIQRGPGSDGNITGSLAARDHIWDLARKGTYLFLAEGRDGVSTVDVSDPRHPERIARVALPGAATRIAVLGERLIVATKRAGIQVVDISNPYRPVLLGTTPVNGLVRDIAVDGNFISVAADKGGVQIFELVDDQYPVLIRQIVRPRPMDHFCRAMAIEARNGLLYVANGNDGLLIVDARQPQSAQVVATLPLPGMVHGLYLDGERAYLDSSDNGIYLVDIATPEQPRSLGRVISMSGALAVLGTEESLLVATGRTGVQEIYQPQELEQVSLESSRQLRVGVPHPGTNGRYSLHVSNRNGQQTLHGIVNFSKQ